ncbi:DBH-like monooxygenase protein 1 homolog [Lineus longissimus]|uniref:DBH-like monooxygenase protein 1 homolog n=1 Tax=Lineus longissimus TaxID=88925 RepID=UPI002B4DAE54
MKSSALSLLVLLFLATRGSADPAPSTTYENNAFIDVAKKIRMYWSHDDVTITMELHAQTVGYVAVGFTPSGRMEGADIIIGWVKAGKAILQDRHATGHTKPLMDPKQDVELLMGKEEDGFTILKFKRKLNTCDQQHDLAIRNGSMKMIWAMFPSDPKDEDSIIYHHTQRGQRNIQLLGVVKKAIPLPANFLWYEFRNQNYTVPSDDTTYSCNVFRMPKVNKKHHLFKFEPIIKKGNKGLVHHIIIFACGPTPAPINDTFEGKQFLCYDKNPSAIPWFHYACFHSIITWAVGGEPFSFPEHVGFSMGTEFDPDFLIMETHYNNEERISGQVDDSGIRIHYTPILRKHDADVLTFGKMIDQNHIIPPKADSFKSFGICYEKCLNDAVEESYENQLNVFAAMVHTHFLGVGIKVGQIRDGIEQPPIAGDKYYDFDYQTIMTLPEERAIKKNDVIATECTYKSTGRENVTYGGFPATQEMCFGFIYYWPRVNLTTCIDRTSDISIRSFAGIEEISSDGLITKPLQYLNKTVTDVINGIDWSNDKTRDAFQKVETFGYRSPGCSYRSGYEYLNELFKFASPTKYYVEPKTECSSAGRLEAEMLISLFVAMMAVFK